MAARGVAADTLLLNGELLTMDPAKTRTQALAVRGDRIVAVGSNDTIRKLRTAHTGAALPPHTDARVLKAIGHLHDHGKETEGMPACH